MKIKLSFRLAFPLASAIFALLASSSVHAGQVWDGGSSGPGDDNWNTLENWDSDALPDFATAITFTGETRNSPVNNLISDTIIGGINFTNDGTAGFANAFILSGARVTLGGNITTAASTPAITDSSSLNLILNGNRTITTNADHNLTISGIISQTGGARRLFKEGSGILTLSGANTHTGGITINGGTLRVGANSVSNLAGPLAEGFSNGVSFANAAGVTLDINGFDVFVKELTGGGATGGNITLNGGTLRIVNPSSGTPAYAGVISGAGNLVNGGSSRQTFTGTHTYTGTTTLAGSFLRVSSLASGNNPSGIGQSSSAAGNLVFSGGSLEYNSSTPATTDRQFTLAANIARIDVVGSGGMNWNSTAAITHSGTASARTLTLGGAGSGISTMAASITNSGTGANVTSVTKDGASTWVISGSNTFTGGVTVNAGTLQLGSAGALNSSAGLQNAVTFGASSSGTLALAGNNVTIANLSTNATPGTTFVQNSNGSNVTNATLTVGNSTNANGTYAGTVRDGTATGTLALAKAGAGTLTLSGANTYTGGTTISAGTLRVAANATSATAGPLGSTSLNGLSIANTAGALLDVNGFDVFARTLTGGGASGGNVTLGTGGTLRIVDPAFSGSFNGVISGAGNFTITGSSGLNFAGSNTYTGTTTISGGVTLGLNNVNALGTNPGVSGTSQIIINNTGQIRPRINGVVINAPINVNSGATANLQAPDNNPGAGVPTTVTLNGAIGGSGNVTFVSRLNANALNTVLLGAASNYAGNTLLDTSGGTAAQIIVKLGANNALPATTVVTIDGQDGTGTGLGRFAEINLNGFSQTLAGLTNTSRTLRAQRVVNSNLSAAATLTISGSANSTFSGRLGSNSADGSVNVTAMGAGATDGNNFSLTKNGAGIFTLSGANTYSGATTITGGTLALGASNVLPDTSNLSIGSATLNAATFTDTVGSLDATGTAVINLGSGGTLAFANSSGVNSGTWAGTLNIIGTLGATSIRFGTTSSGLTSAQLGKISVNGTGLGTYILDNSGYLVIGGAYNTWKSTNAPTGTASDDYDGDGVSNAIEFVLGGLAATNDLNKLPTVSTSGGDLIFTFMRKQSSIDAKTSVSIETSSDLMTWNTLPSPYTVPNVDTGGVINPGVTVQADTPSGFDTVTLRVAQAPDTRKFARLKVVIAP